MGSKISQLGELQQLTGDEESVVALNGNNFKFKLKKVAALVSKVDLGLDKVDNTPDLQKPVSQPMQQALDGKSNTNHTHNVSSIDGLPQALSAKANTQHNHTTGEVNGLAEALDGKANNVHSHEISGVNGLNDALGQKSNVGHGHPMSAINGLEGAFQAVNNSLQNKAAALHQHSTTDVQGLDEFVDQKIADAGGFAEVVFPDPEW